MPARVHINVREFLAEDLGFRRTFAISSETPKTDQLSLAGPIDGEVTLTRLEDGLASRGSITAPVQLDCHRCLRPFTRQTTIKFEALFRDNPMDDDLPIDRRRGEIDLLPLIEQELLVAQPIKLICELDCPGLCETCGLRLDEQHSVHANNQ